jgi:excinuclease ABC subunit B
MNKFKLVSEYSATPDQQNAVKALSDGVEKGMDYQVLLGVTGSGKTFTVANVIEKLQRPALIISHNKTLAAQLYQEFKYFFPENAVSYFVSYYDYYQPEAYVPSTDTYIEKDAGINEMIDKLRLAATTNLLTRNDTIVVASVSCIYNIGSPREYGNFVLELESGMKTSRNELLERLINLQYERGDFGFHRGTFRVRGEMIDIYPAYQDEGVRIEMEKNEIKKLTIFDPVTGSESSKQNSPLTKFILYPAKHYITDPNQNKDVFKTIKSDLKKQVEKLKKQGKELEAHRLKQRVTYDLEMLEEVGYVKGVENYSRYFDGRKPGDPPFSLLDYFLEPYKDDWLIFVDESHITFPQIRGMYAGDMARKKTLIDYGFRLPSALDNRPLRFEEFMRRIPGFIATSATPSEWELNMAKESASRSGKPIPLPKWNTPATSGKPANNGVVEQLLRPTGIPDPEVEIRPIDTQVADVIKEIKKRANPPEGREKQRSLVTTLTKRMAEDLSTYLDEQGIKVQYLHSDVKTLERTDILDQLRRGEYDCIVGVNLLREGLDLPEVSLVAILDADKEGFLRSEVSLIQTMGRAARHIEGRVILYADKITGSIERALSEVKRRRQYQINMNKKYGITPTPILKPHREKLAEQVIEHGTKRIFGSKESAFDTLPHIEINAFTPNERKKIVTKLRKEMKIAARDLNFELAAEIRDKVREIEV